ncbi:hypothetical protein, partial [Salmonella sp. SAL4446]|uniref:hypothetical protein n=1 Tax=Salmonella sp. SAL4446 TaxID=3159901 RepID=UPI00397A3E7A
MSDGSPPAQGAGGAKEKPRQPLRRPLAGLQTSRTPEYLVIGHICADLLPDGKVVLGGTALYSA